MFRSILGFALFAVVAFLALKLVLGLFGIVIGLAMTLLVWAAFGFLIYLGIRIVSPSTAEKIREMVKGRPGRLAVPGQHLAGVHVHDPPALRFLLADERSAAGFRQAALRVYPPIVYQHPREAALQCHARGRHGHTAPVPDAAEARTREAQVGVRDDQ